MADMSRRVLYLSRVSEIGGAERSLLELVANLPRDRFSLEAALPREGELSRNLAAAGVEVHYWSNGQSGRGNPALRRLRAIREGVSASRSIAAITERRSIEIIHANTNRAAALGVAAASISQVPLLWHVRDYPTPVETKILTGCGAIPIAISRSSATRLHAILGRPPVTIENGIDATRFVLRSPRAVGSPIKLLAVANLAEWKGHELLLDAFARVRAQTKRRLVLTLVGGDPFAREQKLSRKIQRKVSALGKDVNWLGSRSDVGAQLADSDLLVHAAFPEPFGRSVLEALCVGVPVIAFDGAHGPADIIRRVGGGLLVAPRTAAALSDAIARAVEQLDACEANARIAAERACRLFSSERVAVQVANLYDQVTLAS